LSIKYTTHTHYYNMVAEMVGPPYKKRKKKKVIFE